MKKQLKYKVLLFVATLIYPLKLASIAGGIIYAANTFMSRKKEMSLLVVIFFFLVAVLLHIGGKIIDIWLEEARMDAEYDEHGHHKKFGSLKKLSRSERKEIEKQKIAADEVTLSSTELKSLTHKGSLKPYEKMNGLVGLKNVKEDMKEMAARMKFEKTKKNHKKNVVSSMHMVFMGPPGTGKTTCARIMTGFLYQNGYIKKNQCIEIDGNFFNGLTAGESSRKATIIIEKALGGVLFIDEAYSLLSGGSAGQEVIATLVKAMEDYKNEFVLILAGYGDEMKQLINSNPGIESRVKRFMWFGNYSTEELGEIFTKMANAEGFCITAEIMEEFSSYITRVRNNKNFGNARTVRNILDKCLDRHAVNLMDHHIAKKDTYKLLGIDFPDMNKNCYQNL